MKYLAWAWTILMIVGAIAVRDVPAVRAYAPGSLAGAMLAAAVPALPFLWGKDGWLGKLDIPVIARVSVVLIALLLAGLAGTPFGAQAWYGA